MILLFTACGGEDEGSDKDEDNANGLSSIGTPASTETPFSVEAPEEDYERIEATSIEEALELNATVLYLSGERLSELPSELWQLTNLRELWLLGNQLTTLPSEIGQLSNLQKLNLDKNQLTTLPPEIGQLTNLRNLDLRYNPLTSIPPEVEALEETGTLIEC